MATGDVQVFNAFAESIGDGRIDLDTDTNIKVALIDDTVTPTAADATPMWSVGSDVDYDANEVSETGFGNYPAGGWVLTSIEWAETAGVCKFDAADVEILQNASGFPDARWGIIYDDDATNNDAIAFVDLGVDVSQVAGPVTISWASGGIFTVTVNDTFT